MLQAITTTTQTIHPLVVPKASTIPRFLGLTEAAVSARLVATQEVRAVLKARRLSTAVTTILKQTPEWQAIVVSRTRRTLTSLVLDEWAVSKTPAHMTRPLAAKAIAAGMSATMTSTTSLALVALQRLQWAPK